MTRRQFPSLNLDGSFSVDILLNLTGSPDEGFGDRVRNWMVDVWTPTHSLWKRVWHTGPGFSVSQDQILNYDESFTSPPEVFFDDGSNICLIIRCNGSSNFWRDWLFSKIIPDLKQSFPEIQDIILIKNSPLAK